MDLSALLERAGKETSGGKSESQKKALAQKRLFQKHVFEAIAPFKETEEENLAMALRDRTEENRWDELCVYVGVFGNIADKDVAMRAIEADTHLFTPIEKLVLAGMIWRK